MLLPYLMLHYTKYNAHQVLLCIFRDGQLHQELSTATYTFRFLVISRYLNIVRVARQFSARVVHKVTRLVQLHLLIFLWVLFRLHQRIPQPIQSCAPQELVLLFGYSDVMRSIQRRNVSGLGLSVLMVTRLGPRL